MLLGETKKKNVLSDEGPLFVQANQLHFTKSVKKTVELVARPGFCSVISSSFLLTIEAVLRVEGGRGERATTDGLTSAAPQRSATLVFLRLPILLVVSHRGEVATAEFRARFPHCKF